MNNLQRYASRLTGAHVDLEKRQITGVVVMTIGKALGRRPIDAKTLEQFAATVAAGKVRGREDHPEDKADKPEIVAKLEKLRGYFYNFHVDGEKLLADFQALSEAAGGPETTRLLHKANEAAEVFGVSPIFIGKPENGFARVEQVFAVDFVDIPAGDNANQQLYQGDMAMSEAIKCTKGEDGKYYAKFEADTKAGTYAVEFPPETQKAIDAGEAAEKEAQKKALEKQAADAKAEDDKKAAEPEAQKNGAKVHSAADLANAKDEGKKEALKYSADFEGAMDAASLVGKDRESFRKAHFEKGQTFGIEYVRELALSKMSARTQPLGEGATGSATAEANGALVERFSAKPSVRAMWGCHTDDKDSDEFKKALVDYLKYSGEAASK